VERADGRSGVCGSFSGLGRAVIVVDLFRQQVQFLSQLAVVPIELIALDVQFLDLFVKLLQSTEDLFLEIVEVFERDHLTTHPYS
jgi:hypothetical protein